MGNEEWHSVVGFETAYEVSNFGRVRSLDRIVPRNGYPFRRKSQVLKPQLDGDGYLQVALGRKHQVKVHKLVAEAFIGNASGLPEIDHDDTDKTNNHASNLRWCTKAQNAMHRHNKTYKTCAVKFTDEQRAGILADLASGMPVLHVSKKFSISRAHARRIFADQ